MNGFEERRQEMQASLDAILDAGYRKANGIFATPHHLASEMALHGLKLLEGKDVRFLEPSIGTGAFYSALLETAPSMGKRISLALGMEKDEASFLAASEIWRTSPLRLVRGDFTRMVPEEKFNLVLANPPYVRHQLIPSEEKERMAKLSLDETGLELSGLAGLYCHFMLLAHKWLAPDAVLGWLVPSEFMDVGYGAAIKKYLLEKVTLLRIHRYDPSSPKFDDALVSSCVVWFKNRQPTGDYEVSFTFGGTHGAPDIERSVAASALSLEAKWTRFPARGERSRENLGSSSLIGDHFDIKRGIATGDNAFFILSGNEIVEKGLDMAHFQPVLPSPRTLKSNVVRGDANGVPIIGNPSFILDCDLDEDEIEKNYPSLWRHLQSGIPGTSSRYLYAKRKKWYFQEKREPALFLCSYMGRGKDGAPPVRFVLNESKAVATNSWLMLYPKGRLKEALERRPELAAKVLEELGKIGACEIEDEGRVYGGGLKKIEPRELARVPCGVLDAICGQLASA